MKTVISKGSKTRTTEVFFRLAIAAIMASNLLLGTAQAQLTEFMNESGRIHVSVDGIATNTGTGELLVERPSASATVRRAFIAGASIGFTQDPIQDGTFTVGGIPVTGVDEIIAGPFRNGLAEITATHAQILNALPVGVSPVAYEEVGQMDGCTLAIIWEFPEASAVSTAVFYFGAQDPVGDQFTISLLNPIDLSNPESSLVLGLGISFGAQDQIGPAGSNLCGSDSDMFSQIDVNGERLTTSAGNCDDADPNQNVADGLLYTVGGIGDSIENPVNPMAQPPCPAPSFVEDELYTLLPFVEDGDMQLVIDTVNPSLDDNIHFGWISTNGISFSGDVVFVSPSPCGETLVATPGEELTFDVIAENLDGSPVTLQASGLPAGGTLTPIPPISGAPAMASFSWIPGLEEIGIYEVNFTAEGHDNTQAKCSFTISFDEVGVRKCFGDGGAAPGCTSCPCGNDAPTGTIGGCLNGGGTSASLYAFGAPSVSADQLTMRASGVTPDNLGVLFSGSIILPNSPADPCFGLQSGVSQPTVLDGLRCLGDARRHGSRASDSAGVIGVSTLPWGPPGGPVGGLIARGQWAAGQTTCWQIFYRDSETSGCGTGINSSNALTMTITP